MNNRDTQLELARRCLDGEASGDEFAQLESLLRNDPEFRRDYLRYLNVDTALAALPKTAEQSGLPNRRSAPFVQWRPLATAAAAGLVFGLFCASVAWAIFVPGKPAPPTQPGARIVLPVLTESFEDPATPFASGFPSRAGEWGGDRLGFLRSAGICFRRGWAFFLHYFS